MPIPVLAGSLSGIEVDTPAYDNYAVSWLQSCTKTDLAHDWKVHGFGTGRVRRFRVAGSGLTGSQDNVYFCIVPLTGTPSRLTTQAFEIDNTGTGAVTAETSYGGSIPNLTGLILRINGQNGLRYDADLNSTSAEITTRECDIYTTRTRWTHATNAQDQDYLGAVSKVFGVHTYLTFRTDTDVIEGALRVSNASINVGELGAAERPAGVNYGDWGNYRASSYGPAFFNTTQLLLPSGWRILWENTPSGSFGVWPNVGVAAANFYSAGGVNNVHLPRMAYVRRFVLYPTTTAVEEAQSILELRSVGRAVSGRCYFNTEAYQGTQSMLPNLDTSVGTPPNTVSAWPGGYASVRTDYANRYATLLDRAITGAFDPNADNTSPIDDFWRKPLGPFRPLGDPNALPPGIEGIAPHTGMQFVREWWLYARFFMDRNLEGCQYFCYHASSGLPVTTKEFGTAAIGHGWDQNASATISPTAFNGWLSESGNPNGRMPFRYDVQGFNVTNAQGIPGLTDKLPVAFGYPANTGQPPLTYTHGPANIQSGSCAYAQELYRWRQRWAGSHLVHATGKAKALAWQIGDLVAIDNIHMICEDQGYAWSEVGSVDNAGYPPSWSNTVKDKLAMVSFAGNGAHPFDQRAKGLAWLGREAGWVAESFALSYALSTNARRTLLKPRLQAMHDLYKNNCTPSGANGQQLWSGGQGNGIDTEAWNVQIIESTGLADPAQIAPANAAVYSLDIQSTLSMNGWYAICKQLPDIGGGDPGLTYLKPLFLRLINQALKPTKSSAHVTNPTDVDDLLRWTGSEYQVSATTDPPNVSRGPAKYIPSGFGPGPGIPNGFTDVTMTDVTIDPTSLDNKLYEGSGIGTAYWWLGMEFGWRLTANESFLHIMNLMNKAYTAWPAAALIPIDVAAANLLGADSQETPDPLRAGNHRAGLAAYTFAWVENAQVPIDSSVVAGTVNLNGVIRVGSVRLTGELETTAATGLNGVIIVSGPVLTGHLTLGSSVTFELAGSGGVSFYGAEAGMVN